MRMITYVLVLSFVENTSIRILFSILLMFLIDFKMLFSVSFSVDYNFWDFWNHKSKDHLKGHHNVFNRYNHNQELDHVHMSKTLFFRWTKDIVQILLWLDENLFVDFTGKVNASYIRPNRNLG